MKWLQKTSDFVGTVTIKILSLDFDSEDVKNTLEMLSLIDADDNFLE